MATSTLIQDLSSTSVACSARRKVETYWASAAITAGQWVTFDQTKTGVERSKYVKPADAGAAAGATVKVVAGTQMTIGTTAGMAVLLHEIAGAHTQGQAVGYALEDSVGATVDCIVTCSPS